MTKAWATLLMVFAMAGLAVGQVNCTQWNNDSLTCSDGTTAHRFGDDWNFSDGGRVHRFGDQFQITLPTPPPAPQPTTQITPPPAAASSNSAAAAALGVAVGAVLVYTITWAIENHRERKFEKTMEEWRLTAIKSCETFVGEAERDPDPRLVALFKIASAQDFGECAQTMFENHLVVSDFRARHPKVDGTAKLPCAVALTMGHSERRFGKFTPDDLQREWDTVDHDEDKAAFCP